MDLANILSLVLNANVDPSSAPEINVEPEVTETLIGRNLPKVGRGKKLAAVLAEVSAPIHSTAQAPSVTIAAPVEKLDARAFFKALSKAKTRDENIAAIAGYTGQTVGAISADFGNADREARAAAQRELRGTPVAGPSREEIRAAHRSAAGFVAGMPAPAQKLLANLVAREKAAVNAMIDAKSPQEKAAHATVLEGIREAMAKLV
jgi:hypothetical protein